MTQRAESSRARAQASRRLQAGADLGNHGRYWAGTSDPSLSSYFGGGDGRPHRPLAPASMRVSGRSISWAAFPASLDERLAQPAGVQSVRLATLTPPRAELCLPQELRAASTSSLDGSPGQSLALFTLPEQRPTTVDAATLAPCDGSWSGTTGRSAAVARLIARSPRRVPRARISPSSASPMFRSTRTCPGTSEPSATSPLGKALRYPRHPTSSAI